MAFEFKLPDIGEGVVEGEIVKWLVKPGDPVGVDEPMVEVMTDKATVVIPSPVAGKIVSCHGAEGDLIKIHSLLVTIDPTSSAAAGADEAAPAATAPSEPAPAASEQTPETSATPPARPTASTPSVAAPAAPARGDGRAEPRAAPSRDPATRESPRGTNRAEAADGTRLATPRSSSGQGSAAAGLLATAGGTSSARPGGLAPTLGSNIRGANGGLPEKVLAAPATRRLARELGIDITRVPGSGPNGRVTSTDVAQASALPLSASAVPSPQGSPGAAAVAELDAPLDDAPSSMPVAPPAPPTRSVPSDQGSPADETIPVRGLRRRIWEKMAQSAFTAAHFTFVDECDATDLVALRERFNAALETDEPRLTYLPFIMKAAVAALRRFPMLNGHVDDQAMTFVRRADYHLGVAVASERGLVVPVVRHADRLSLLDLGREIVRLSEAVRSNQIRSEDLGGSTFTITSLGKDGGIFATPIINYPEVAILGVHKLHKRPVVNERDEIVVRSMMNFSLSFDHRLVDGHVGAAFATALIRLLERPDRLMIEMS